MTHMNAAVWHGPGAENFRLERVALPQLQGGDVLIRVKKCFFCAMHARAVLTGHAKHSPPVIFGRMLAGDVAAVGSSASSIAKGMRVTVNPEQPCGSCYYCQRQAFGHCLHPTTLSPGGMAEFVRVPSALTSGIHELNSNVPYESAAFAETLACALQGIELADIHIGDTVVIIGDGGVGLCFLQLAGLQGASRIIMAGKHDQALQSARSLGAATTVNVTRDDLRQAVLDMTQGHGADVAIEATGTADAYAQALTLLRCEGVAVGFGGTTPGSLFKGDPNLIHYRSLRLHGSYRYRPVHFHQAVNLIQKRHISLAPVITHHVPFKEVTTNAVNICRQPDCRALVIDFDSNVYDESPIDTLETRS